MELESNCSGLEDILSELGVFITTISPPFIFIKDATNPRVTSEAIKSLFLELGRSIEEPPIRSAHIDALLSFTPRLLYDLVLNELCNWEACWDNGCRNWCLDDEVGDPQRWNDNFDGFLRGLRAISGPKGLKGKQGQKATGGIVEEEPTKLFLLFEHAERLQEFLPELVAPLTRLRELSRVEATVIFLSESCWEDMRPPLGTSFEPYFINVSTPSKEVIVDRLVTAFRHTCESVESASSSSTPSPYSLSLLPLYSHFATVFCSVCYPFVNSLQDLAYVAAARWPGFVQPFLEQSLGQKENVNSDDDEVRPKDGASLAFEVAPPTEDERMRLTRLFTPTFTSALDSLYPRLTNASNWAAKNKPPPDVLSIHPSQVSLPSSTLASRVGDRKSVRHGDEDDILHWLPRMSKFILIAAFLASTNPAKTDIRMFGRGLDEKKRKRKRGSARKPTANGVPSKVPQRLLGPLPFPLDRLLAILGILLEENDADSRPIAPEYTIPGEYTEMEISRVRVYSTIVQLSNIRLLHRTTPSDKIDSPPMFKCGATYETVLELARQVDVPLNDLFWDPS